MMMNLTHAPVYSPLLLCSLFDVKYLCVRQYPEWLDSNRQSLSAEDVQRYEQQHRIMGEICSQFERDGDTQSSFENILELMQKVQRHRLCLSPADGGHC